MSLGYAGFISYSHAADGRLAPSLHRGLQRLAKRWNSRQALRIFRDETGLSTNPHLWSAIEDALDTSDWFVLLASPEASQSEWIAKEISHWLATKSTDRILPVVTGGEWEWDPSRHDFTPASTAVPDALRGAFREEPRHLDLRWARDETDLDLRNSRFRSAVADLAAPMHGIAKDDLESEDIRQHRRARRLARSAVTGLALLLVVAVISAILAVSQRGRADRQAARAVRQTTIADARRLAAQAVSGTHDDLARSALLAIEGQRLHDERDTQGALLTVAQQAMPIRTLLHGSWDTAALAPDGRTVAVAGPKGLFRIDLGTGRSVQLGRARFRGLRSADFSPDGRTLALGADVIHLIDARTGARLRPPLRMPAADGTEVPLVTALRFAPDGHRLAAMTDSGIGRVWSVPGGRELGRFDTDTYVFNGLDFSPDGRILAGTGYPGFDIDSTSMRALHPANNDLSVGDEYGLAFSPDGAQVAVGRIGSIVFRSPTTGLVSGPTIDTGTSAAELLGFRADGRVIAAARTDGSVSLWDSVTGRERAALVGATRGPLVLRFLRNGNTLVLVTGAEIIVYDLDAGIGFPLPSRVPANFAYGRSSIAVSSDGVVAATDTVGGVEVWDASTRHEQRRIDATRSVGFGATAAAFQPGTHVFALAAGDGTVTRWDADHGRMVGKPIRLTEPNPTFGVIGSRGVFGVAFDASGRSLAALAGDGSVAIIDTARWSVLRRIKLQPSLAFGAVAISPDGRTVAAAGPSSVAVANVAGTVIRQLDLGRVAARSLAFGADGRMLAAGLTDGRIALIDPQRGALDGTPLVSGHGGIDSLALDASRGHLAAGSEDGTVRLWDLATHAAIGAPLAAQSKRVNALAFTPDGNAAIAGSSDGTVVAYDLTVPHWIRSLCRIAGRNLTRSEWQGFLGDRAYRRTCSQWPPGA